MKKKKGSKDVTYCLVIWWPGKEDSPERIENLEDFHFRRGYFEYCHPETDITYCLANVPMCLEEIEIEEEEETEEETEASE